MKDIEPRRFDSKNEEIQGKHQQAIEEKEATIELLNDNLKNRNNQIQVIQYESMVRTSYKNVKKSLPILRHVIFPMQKIQAKTTLL